MSRQANREDAVEMDNMIRRVHRVTNESTYAFLVRRAGTSDLPLDFVDHMRKVLLWLWPQLTERTRPMYTTILALVDQIDMERPRSRIWHPPMTVRVSNTAIRAAAARYTAQREQVMALFEDANSSHLLEPILAAQEAFRQAQSVRASKPRKLPEEKQRTIAKRYLESKRNGSTYGIVKALAVEYDVSTTTIQTAVKKYKPD